MSESTFAAGLNAASAAAQQPAPPVNQINYDQFQPSWKKYPPPKFREPDQAPPRKGKILNDNGQRINPRRGNGGGGTGLLVEVLVVGGGGTLTIEQRTLLEG